MKRSFLCMTLWLFSMAFIIQLLNAQDSSGSAADLGSNATGSIPPTAPELSAAIAAKEAEVAKLKEQLELAKVEIKDLHSQNEKLKTSDKALEKAIQTVGPDTTPLRASPTPLAGVPEDFALIDSQDLFWYFHNSPDLANQYLRGRPIRVSGEIVGFAAPILSRVFGVLLKSEDPNLRVICRFVIPPVYAAVIFERHSGTIFGRTAMGGQDPLLNIGDIVKIEGKCEGNDDGDVALNSCRLIP